jgi:hypothetical protein
MSVWDNFGLRYFGGRIRLTAGSRIYQHAPLQRRRAFAPHHPQERCSQIENQLVTQVWS